MTPSVGWSNFALKHHFGIDANARVLVSPEAFLSYIPLAWEKRVPGFGREAGDLSAVVVVPLALEAPAQVVRNCWLSVTQATDLKAEVIRRQAHEDPFVLVTGVGEPTPTKHVRVVLYSAANLLANGGSRSGPFEWEIVAVLATPWDEPEPMQPLTMARNYLQKPGGTFCAYTVEQFAFATYFWSQYIPARSYPLLPELARENIIIGSLVHHSRTERLSPIFSLAEFLHLSGWKRAEALPALSQLLTSNILRETDPEQYTWF